MKILVIIIFAAIIVSMGSALFNITSRRGDSKKVTRAFVHRLVLSGALIAFLLLAWIFGWIETP